MKKTIFFLLTSVFILSANAQQWAKHYTGADGSQSFNLYNSIYNTAYDSQGNIYILGTFGGGATYDGEALLDYFTHSNNSQSLLIAKLDQNGNMLWRKAIKNGQSSDVYPNYMQIVGDTSVVIAASMNLAADSHQDYLFYLDTLIQSPVNQYVSHQYPFPNLGDASRRGNALITLDLNGNIVNQHFLEIKFLNSNGVAIGPIGSDVIFTDVLWRAQGGGFHIDKQGYIYIYNVFSKSYEAESFQIRVDGQRDLDPFTISYYSNCKLLKFSPNFTDIIWSKDLIVDTLGYGEEPMYFTCYARGMAVDTSGGIYVTGFINTFRDGYGDSTCYKEARVDTNNPNHRIKINAGDDNTGFIVKYNSDGDVMWTNQLYGRKESFPNPVVSNVCRIDNVVISEENNAAYIVGTGHVYDPCDLYFEDSIKMRRYCDTSSANFFFAKFNKETGSYISHGIAPSHYSTSDGNNYFANNSSITVKNNQVFAQTVYLKDIIGIDTVFRSINQNYGAGGLAFIRWKDNGYIIDVKDFPTNTTQYKLQCRNTVVNDNGDMILTGMFNQNIDFGDISLISGTNSSAYIVKFNDPSFLVPFVGGDTLNDRQPQALNDISIQKENEILVYPNPTKDEVYIRTKGEQINSYSIYNINGQVLLNNEKVKTNSEKISLIAFPKGVYILKVVTDKNVYSRKVIKN